MFAKCWNQRTAGKIFVSGGTLDLTFALRACGKQGGERQIAPPAFIDNAAITTARQSENAPKASDAATASINRGEATLALWPLKPCAPVNRVMAGNPLKQCAGESPAELGEPWLFVPAILRQFGAGFAAGVNGR
jgi:hypothetical protein